MVKLGTIPMLESLNATVDAVESGEEAIEHFKLQEYDLVFMDIGLPGIDGYETTRRIRAMEKGKTLPIIAVTAHALDEVKSRCDQVGMTGAIQKPLTPEDTLTFFNTYLYDKGYLINESVVPKKKEDPHKHLFDLSKSIVKLGSEAAVNSYLKSLIVYLSDSLALMTELEFKKDSITLAKEVHKLKGALSLVEAPELSEAVVQFNNGLKVGQRGNIPALLAATVKAADVFKQHIAQRVIPKNPE